MKLKPELRFPEFINKGEWFIEELGQISEIVRGGSPRPIQEYLTTKHNGLNWLKIADVPSNAKYITKTKEKVIQEAINSTREVNTGDLILSNSMSFGRPYILKIKTCIHDGWIAIRKISNRTFEDYLYYFISSESSQNYFLVNAAGAAVKNLNAEIIKLLPIYLPKEIKEQQKIASCLSSLDQLITAHSDRLQALKDHKNGLLQNLFPQDGETVPKYRFPEFEKDGEWVEKKLGEIANFSSGGTPSKGNPKYWGGNIPWISASSMYDINISQSDLRITQYALDAGARIVGKGTILILVRGSMLFNRVPIGITTKDVVFNQDVKALALKDEYISQFILYHLIAYENYIPIDKTGIGAGKIGLDELKSLNLFIPKNTQEQKKIASCLSTLYELIQALKEKIEQLQQHKKGLMQGLFPKIEH